MQQQIAEQIHSLKQKLLQCIDHNRQLHRRLLRTDYSRQLAIEWNQIQSYLSAPFIIGLPQPIVANQQAAQYHHFGQNDSATQTGELQRSLNVIEEVKGQVEYKKDRQEAYQRILENQISDQINEDQLLPIHTNPQINQQGTKKIKPRRNTNNQDFQPPPLIVPVARQLSQVSQQINQDEEIDQDQCNDHGKRYFYQYHQQQKEKKKRELCNMCLHNLQHKHKVICKRHNNIIKLKMKQINIEQNLQIFLCQQCQQNPNYQSYELICDKHFHPIHLICFDEICIENDTFFICKQCQQNHDHQHITFDIASLKQRLICKRQLRIEGYQKYLVLAKQKIKMSSFSKILKQIKNYTGLLQAISIYNQKTLKLWTNKLMGSRQKQTMKILCSLQNINLRQQSQRFQRHLLLEVFSDRITDLQLNLYKQIQQKIELYNSQIEKQFNLDYDEIQKHLNNKYKDIQFNEVEQINKPCERFQQLQQHHFSRVESITFKMYSEETQRDSESLRLKSKRRRLYQLFNLQYNSDQTKKTIKELFYTPDKIECKTDKDQDNFNNQEGGADQQENIKISKYKEQYCQCSIQQQEKYHKQSRQFHSVSDPKFTSLQKIKIIYEHQSHLIDLKSQISLDSILQLINSNKNLREIELDGLEIRHFQKFIRSHYQRKVYLPKDFRISLCANIQLIVNNKHAFNQQVDAFIFFINSVQYVSNIKISLNLTYFQEKSQKLEQLLKVMKKIDKKRISLYKYHLFGQDQDYKFQQLIKSLAQLTKIEQLELQSIIFEEDLVTGQIIQNFTKIIEEATHLQIRIKLNYKGRCQFHIKPKLKRIETLTFIQYENTFYDSEYVLLQNIQNPNLLKQLKIDYEQYNSKIYFRQWKQITLKHLNKLEYLVISNIALIKVFLSLQIESRDLSIKYLQDIQLICKSLKYLNLQSSQFSQINEQVFEQLTQITKLRLCNIKVTVKNISAIPSIKLQELSLEKCQCITNSIMLKIDEKFKNLKRLAIKQEQNNNKSNYGPQNDQKQLERQALFQNCKYYKLLHFKINKQLLTTKEDTFIADLRTQGTVVLINK